MELGDRIRLARAHAGFHTGTSFARAVGIRAETLNRAENGHTQPSSSTLLRIAQESGVRMEWLMTGSGSMVTPRQLPGQPPPDAPTPEAA